LILSTSACDAVSLPSFQKDPEHMDTSRIAQLRQMSERFGLDAAARAKLEVKQLQPPSEDPAEKYFEDHGIQ
jgi:phage terminase small subunit